MKGSLSFEDARLLMRDAFADLLRWAQHNGIDVDTERKIQARFFDGNEAIKETQRNVVLAKRSEDSFSLVITSAWGDSWEWIAINPERAQDVWERLGHPNLVHLESRREEDDE